VSLGFLIECTLLLALALLLERACADARLRAALGFGAVCALPLLWLADRLHLGWQPWVQQVAADSAANASPNPQSTAIALATVYAVVASWRLLRWLGAQVAVHRLERRAQPCRQPRWQRLNANVAAMSGTRRVPVLVQADIGAPFLAGLLRPGIHIPAHLLSCSEARAHQVLLHEYAHLRARDGWRVQTIELATCLLWFHPLLHVLRRRFLRDIELACDAQVLRAGVDAHDYAATLAHCAGHHRQLAAARLGMAVSRSDLVQRVRLILRADAPSNVPAQGWIAPVLCAVALSLSAVNLAPRILVAVPDTLPAATALAVQPAVPTAELATEDTRNSGIAPGVELAPSRRLNTPVESAAAPESGMGALSSAAEAPDSARLWQSMRNVAAEDAAVYAASHSEPLVDPTPLDARFENGLRQGRAERSEKRQRIMKRLWPLFGRVPL
jgi:beta-lactamase regulating signal transducer with metallopeptidase domain